MFYQLLFWVSILGQTAVDDPHRFNNYLILGYGMMWLIGLVYMISLMNRQRNLKQDLQLMKKLLEEDETTAVE